MYRRHPLSLVLCLLLALSLVLCGCGGDNGSETTDNTTTAATGDETTESTHNQVSDGKATYTVTVQDEEGNPMEGVTIQFCDEASVCQLPVKTDANGRVEKKYTEKEYHVSVTVVPEGYEAEEAYYFADGSYELTITLKIIQG